MRLVAFFQHMPPYSGAAALRGRSILRGLHEVAPGGPLEVYTTTPNPDPLPGGTVTTLPGEEVENALSLLRRMLGELRVGWTAARSMFPRRGGERVALISSPAYLTALVISTFARWRRVPYVLELRDVYPQVYAEAGLLRRESLAYGFFAARSRAMYKHAAKVIVATHGLGREVSEAAGDTPVVCVYNGFPREMCERRARKHERFTVCFHGVLGFFQDVETLVALARRLATHEVDVVAIGYGRKEPLLAEARLSNLRFLGRQPHAATIAEVERCHVGLCLRLDDGISKDAFPVKVWEYIGLGIPSVVTPPCEAGDFLERHGCGIQQAAGDVDALLTVVLALKADPSALERMSARCRDVGVSYTREQTGREAARAIVGAFGESLAEVTGSA
ncbi:hypothetical protein PLCT1_01431 [Planctomycetaceae bacterium]|nr:hypothetical protein PLCT1_01431 [Planctomycetaceae bacterium]